MKSLICSCFIVAIIAFQGMCAELTVDNCQIQYVLEELIKSNSECTDAVNNHADVLEGHVIVLKDHDSRLEMNEKHIILLRDATIKGLNLIDTLNQRIDTLEYQIKGLRE